MYLSNYKCYWSIYAYLPYDTIKYVARIQFSLLYQGALLTVLNILYVRYVLVSMSMLNKHILKRKVNTSNGGRGCCKFFPHST